MLLGNKMKKEKVAFKLDCKNAVLFILLIVCPFFLQAQLVRDNRMLSDIKVMLQAQKQLAAGRSHELFDVFNNSLTADERQALEFLYAYMPLSDLSDYDGDFFLNQVQSSLKARSEMPWGMTVPEDIFLSFVLPPRVNNENLDMFRVIMYDELKRRVQGMTLHDAILEVNHWCHEKVTYRGSDERTSSPLASLKTSFGRCGEESTFTVTALRTLGIPTRQVYTPRWAHSDDNHAWVEVWIDGKWYFLGACEPDPELNMGWFAEPARRAMLVHTRAYGKYFGNETIIDREEKFAELNLISNYAICKKLVVQVIDEKKIPINEANVEYQLYNYAEFYPIAKNITNPEGYSELTSGLGDLVVYAYKNDKWGFVKVAVGVNDTIHLTISSSPDLSPLNLDIIPPVEKTPLVEKASQSQKVFNANRLILEDSIRANYMSSFKDTAWIAAFAEDNNLDQKRLQPLFQKSYGNWKEIADFLKNTPTYRQEWAIRLLENISDKDLRDTKSEILSDHLMNSFGFNNPLSTSDPDFYAQYVVSGRISNEMMLPWRKFLQKQFDYEFIMKFKSDVNSLTDWINSNIEINNEANLHSRAPLSPRGVFELKVADKHSRDIFFVAVCRSLGQAARLNSETGIPQYYSNSDWHNVVFEPSNQSIKLLSTIHFVESNSSMDPKYAINFTIARYLNGVFRTIDFEYGKALSLFPREIEVVAGNYMLITGNRQSDGSVLSSVSFFEALPGKNTEVKVEIRENSNPTEPWGKLILNGVTLNRYSTNEVLHLAELNAANPSIFIWIEPDKEPSKHVMADLPAVRKTIEKSGVNLFFLLSEQKISKAFNPKNYQDLPEQHIFAFDKGNQLLKQINNYKQKTLSSNLPVIVISDAKGNLIYFSEGYKIGVGEQLAKEIQKLKK